MRPDINGASCWIEGCEGWIYEGVADGWRPYYVSIMFDALRGPSSGIIQQMHQGIHRGFYSRFCTEFTRNPRAPSQQERLPRLMLFPDRPVWKHRTHSLREVTINAGGLHFNGPMLIPPVSRFRECPIQHIQENQALYAKRGIARIHVKEITHNVARVADYSGKTVKWHRTNEEDILILPKALSELPTRSRFSDDPRTKRLQDIQAAMNLSDEVAEHIVDANTC